MVDRSSLPLAWYPAPSTRHPGTARGTGRSQGARGFGIHWPDVDEDFERGRVFSVGAPAAADAVSGLIAHEDEGTEVAT